MKVDTQKLNGFQPVRVTITLESVEELSLFRCVFSCSAGIAGYLHTATTIKDEGAQQIKKMLDAVYDSVECV